MKKLLIIAGLFLGAAVAMGQTFSVGKYATTPGNTNRSDANRWNDRGYNIKEFGAIGDGNSHSLSSIYGSLAAAQAVYPFVSDLSQEVDWAATQLAINTAYGAAPASNAQTIYCPVGSYQLSQPLIVDMPNNSAGSAAAWASGTTYGNGALVTWNGTPYSSLGSGNVGNTPYSADGYPQFLTIPGNGTNYANITISNASPAVVTMQGGAHGLTAGVAVVFFTDTFTAGAALPTGISANQVYYVISTGLTSTQFEFSATPGGAAVNTSSAGTGNFTITDSPWQVAIQTPSNFGSRNNFVGDDGGGCKFVSKMLNSPAIVLGPNQNNHIKNITILGGSDANSTGYRCQQNPNLVGFGQNTSGGGSSVSYFENVRASGFYSDWKDDAFNGFDNLGDSNTFLKSQFQDGCQGLWFVNTQQFINSVYDTLIGSNDIAIKAINGVGVNVSGGNHSANNAASTAFAVTSASGTWPNITATITSPDSNLTNPWCGYQLSCVYNRWTIVTQDFGAITLIPKAWNVATSQLTLTVDPNAILFATQYDTTTAMTEMAAATKWYAAETVTTYLGDGIQVSGTHIENGLAATTVMDGTVGFAPGKFNRLTNVNINSDLAQGDFACCEQTVSDGAMARFLAQNVGVPYLSPGGTPLAVDSLVGASDSIGNERLLIQGSCGGNNTPQFTYRSDTGDIQKGGFNWRVSTCSGQSMTGNYTYESAAFGWGQFENSFQSIPNATSLGNGYACLNANVGVSCNATDWASYWRGASWGAAPTWGVRPAPWSMPCILPSDVTQLGALPTIDPASSTLGHIANTQSGLAINSGGTGYVVGDTITLVGGTSTTAATVHVDSVSSGVITGFHITNGGTYTVEANTFTSTGGSGTGATWQKPYWVVSYNISYPLLWGGTTYRVCDWQIGTQTHYGVMSTNTGYSYFQNLTTTNVPNLSWSAFQGSDKIYLNNEALQLMFPGLVFTLPSGAGNCAVTNKVIVTGVHQTLGYVDTVRVSDAINGSNPYVVGFLAGGTRCTGTSLTMDAPNLVNPF